MFLFFFSFLFLFFKYERLVFILLGIEFLFFSLLVYYVFLFESVMFFYFLCFGLMSGVLGLVIFFFCVKGFGVDKVMFYFL
uniref:NADH dehydrogenase subunit 4L n=2 Tax=Onchocerca TaxID=6281 RepID=O47577_ONCVO|nr:NADH dehydrogenase subunit 4L [Onchocerca volvulus]YP_009550071.1 NADH dehydrogenase subunit 4L [Onchocerca ochengi]AAC61616.1 NADH dehydrogenase subunit 4L [Onchocerca volvulus]ALG63678.1 NADH dehydrogenase subunit 4L [Onchocerca volvulus]APA19082.1 NADH dehydrogenase subunit 4L [Onchocerca ochengi]APA19094.1 NADH dehydrogenase subunit 4L [Onchocerca ochengi]BAV82821.1 NADH dehydrogenase subunit 4L [Onchocerca volvulus]